MGLREIWRSAWAKEVRLASYRGIAQLSGIAGDLAHHVSDCQLTASFGAMLAVFTATLSSHGRRPCATAINVTNSDVSTPHTLKRAHP